MPADNVRLWDASTGEQIKVLPGPYGAVKSLAFLPDGKALLVAGKDGSTSLFRVPDGSQLATLRTVTGKDAGYIFNAGHIDFVGSQACAARSHAICRYGSLSFPLEVCEERVVSRGLLAKVLAGDSSYADPESESEPMRCGPAAME